MQGRDARFDGRFYIAVKTTRIYCRPSCPARTPKPENVRFYPSAAAAQRSGFRACKRCRPDASPGSPEWDVRGDLAGRALRLIGDGVIDRDGVPGLARRLGYSERQVNRSLIAEVGAGPLALARAQRAQTARVLLETSDLPAGDVAFAAGLRQHPAVQRHDPGRVRRDPDAAAGGPAAPPSASARRHARHARAAAALPARRCRCDATLAFLAARAIPGVESFDGALLHPVAAAARRPGDRRDQRRRRLRALPHPAHRPARPGRRGRRGCAGCSTSTPTRSPSTRSSARDPQLAPLVAGRARACARPVPSTGSRWRCARSSASRSRWPARARCSAASPPSTGSRRSTARPLRLFPHPDVAGRRRRRCRCPRPASAPSAPSRRRWPAVQLSLDPGADRADTRDALLALPGIGRGPPTTSPCARSPTPTCCSAPISAWSDSAESLGIDLSRRAPRLGARGAATPPTTCGRLHHVEGKDGIDALHDDRLAARRPARDRRRGRADRALPAAPAGTSRRRPTAPGATTPRSPTSASSSTSTSPASGWSSSCGSTRTAPPFQLKVWLALREIPYGETASYGQQAQAHRRPRLGARGRSGQRAQPDLDHRAVPPGHRRRRFAHRLRGRHRRPSAGCSTTRPSTPA